MPLHLLIWGKVPPQIRESMFTHSLDIINNVQPRSSAKPNTKQSIAHPTDANNHHTFTCLPPIISWMLGYQICISDAARFHSMIFGVIKLEPKNHVCKCDCSVLHSHKRQINLSTSMHLFICCRQHNNVQVKNELRSVKKYSHIFWSYLWLVHPLAHPWISWVRNASTLLTSLHWIQSIAAQKGNEKNDKN